MASATLTTGMKKIQEVLLSCKCMRLYENVKPDEILHFEYDTKTPEYYNFPKAKARIFSNKDGTVDIILDCEGYAHTLFQNLDEDIHKEWLENYWSGFNSGVAMHIEFIFRQSKKSKQK